MMMKADNANAAKYVILGGGMVAGYAAKEFAKLGLEPGELMIISAEDALPYERPPLSKGLLAGRDSDDSVYINDAEFYSKHGIALKLKTTITKVDVQSKLLRSTSDDSVPFQNLLLATGARAKTLDIPGHTLPNIFYLRSLADSKNIRARATQAQNAVVIGGGFIGMEVASVLAEQKIQTTMVIRENRVWSRLFTPEMSAFFERYYTERGVKLARGASVAAFEGTDSVQSVVLTSGQKLECNLAVVGVGAAPVTEPFANSGILIDDGVVVNEYLETNHAGIHAAGDIANYPDSIFQKRRRVEHWDNAVSQGQHWAQMMMSGRKKFEHVPYFFSDVFDLSYELWGDARDSDQTVVRGDIKTPSFSVWWLKQNRLRAMFAMNRPDKEREIAPKWIQSAETISPERLAQL